MNRKHFPCWLATIAIAGWASSLQAQAVPIVSEVAAQPLVAQVKRLVEAMEFLGEPLSADTVKAIDQAAAEQDESAIVKRVQEIVDPLCLAVVEINPESRVKSQA